MVSPVHGTFGAVYPNQLTRLNAGVLLKVSVTDLIHSKLGAKSQPKSLSSSYATAPPLTRGAAFLSSLTLLTGLPKAVVTPSSRTRSAGIWHVCESRQSPGDHE